MKHTWKAKLILSLFGLALGLVILELGLRLGGFILLKNQNRSYIPNESSYIEELRYKRDDSYEQYKAGAEGQQLKKIVCIGDSFANGGNARSFQTYPYFLFKEFEASGNPAIVLNMGKCEDSTFGVAQRLKLHFDAVDEARDYPDLITFVVGSADKYNLNPQFTDNMKWVKVDWHKEPPKRWYQHFRVYKLIRHIRLSLFSKKLTEDLKENTPVTDDVIDYYVELYNQFKENHNQNKTADPEAFKRENRRIAAAFRQKAKHHFSAANNEYLTIQTPEEVLNSLSTGLVILYAAKIRHDDALDLILDVERHFPLEFWDGNVLFYLRYNLYQIYQLQSKYTAQEVLALLNRTKEEFPQMDKSTRFNKFYDMIANWDKLDEMVNQKRKQTWDQIVTMCRERNIEMLLQNYPSDYKSANGMIDWVAKTYDIPLVDNHGLFDKLAAENGRQRYLEDDDHCSPEGYEAMAKAVFAAIAEHNLLK
jgi:lysophospholipase L1-like esterase